MKTTQHLALSFQTIRNTTILLPSRLTMRHFCLIVGLLSIVIVVTHGDVTSKCDGAMLQKIISGTLRSADYMYKKRLDINLDGLMGSRIASDQLKAVLLSYLKEKVPKNIVNQLRGLQVITNITVEEALFSVFKQKPRYYEDFQFVLKPSFWDVWYPVRKVNSFYKVEPLSCNGMKKVNKFNESKSDKCIHELSLKEKDGMCSISDDCKKLEITSGNKDYTVTHQVLYFIIAEKEGCMTSFPAINGEILRDTLCANVLRDAERIAEANFKDRNKDLFLEQIAVCGMWGYIDFFNNSWLKSILDWQKPSGCFVHRHRHKCEDYESSHGPSEYQVVNRIKREDKLLSDGCSSHTTAVGLAALVMHLRFCLEIQYNPLLSDSAMNLKAEPRSWYPDFEN